MGKNLVLVGGGHAHMTVLLRLKEYIDKGHSVTLISLSPYHYYSGMGPGLLSGIYRRNEVLFHIKRMAESRGGNFIEGRVIRIDPEERIIFLKTGHEVKYDIVSLNTGSEVPRDFIIEDDKDIISAKPVGNLLNAHHILQEKVKNGDIPITVIGGGATGIEIAGNLWRLISCRNINAKISLIDGRGVLSNHPERVRRLAKASLLQRGVSIFEGEYVQSFIGNKIVLKSGKTIESSLVFLAAGVKPSPIFQSSNLPTGDDGGLLVNRYLQSTAYREIFGGGDCISLEDYRLARVGVYAVRQNPILHYNIHAALQGKPLRAFDPGGPYLLILNMGDGRGILWKKNFVWEGRSSFKFKDYLDRRFMKRFQVSGELNYTG
jgi:NADH dehydrogenase FAD-containing subunit